MGHYQRPNIAILGVYFSFILLELAAKEMQSNFLKDSMAQVMFLRENYMEFPLLAHKRIHSSHHLRQQMNSKIQFYLAKTIRMKV